ncbi:MAG: flavodoxin [Clostridia bacterium]|nr:flavodoxin [Clostridia bacterium]
MKTLIVYYSMGGNTALAAKKAAEALGADTLEIKPDKAYPDKGLRKFLWGGKSAVMAETPALQPCAFHPEDYEQIILGFPVWAANIAPPLRTFVRDNLEALKTKRLAAFACQSGSGGEKALQRLADLLAPAALTAQTVLIDPRDRPGKDNESRLKGFCEQCR